jgi:hypothetical protein
MALGHMDMTDITLNLHFPLEEKKILRAFKHKFPSTTLLNLPTPVLTPTACLI